MATKVFHCVRCGHTADRHKPNFVNEPCTEEWAWLEEVQDGYLLDILTCMETALPADYLKTIEDLYWMSGNDQPYGYQSPDPIAEDKAIEQSKPPLQSGSGSFVLILGQRPIPLG